MHTDTLFLSALILAQSTVVSLIRMGLEEVILKPLAIRHTKRILGAIADNKELLQKAWDILDFSLTDNVQNILGFLRNDVEYIAEQVLPKLEETDLTEDQQVSLVSYLSDNWSEVAFLDKVTHQPYPPYMYDYD